MKMGQPFLKQNMQRYAEEYIHKIFIKAHVQES